MIVGSLYREYFELYTTTNIPGELAPLSGKVKADFDVTRFKNGQVSDFDYDIREIDPVTSPGYYAFEFVPDEPTDYYIEFDLDGDPINPDFVIDGQAHLVSIDNLVMGGNRSVTITVINDDGTLTPIPDVTIDIYNSSMSLRMTGRSLVTNSEGKASQAMKDGTYKVRMVKAGYTFTSPETLTVSGNTLITYEGGGPTPRYAPAPGMQTIVGNVRKLNWAVATGEVIKARIGEGKQQVGGALILTKNITSTVDAESEFSFTVPCGCRIILSIPNHGDHDIDISTTSGIVDVATYIL